MLYCQSVDFGGCFHKDEHLAGALKGLVFILNLSHGLHETEDAKQEGEHSDEHILRLERISSVEVVNEESLGNVNDSESTILDEFRESELDALAISLLDLTTSTLVGNVFELFDENTIVCDASHGLVVCNRVRH